MILMTSLWADSYSQGVGARAGWINTEGSIQPELPPRKISVLFTTVRQTIAAVRAGAQLVVDTQVNTLTESEPHV
jgi:hypothetical protein